MWVLHLLVNPLPYALLEIRSQRWPVADIGCTLLIVQKHRYVVDVDGVVVLGLDRIGHLQIYGVEVILAAQEIYDRDHHERQIHEIEDEQRLRVLYTAQCG